MINKYKPPIWPPKLDIPSKFITLDDTLRYDDIKNGRLYLLDCITTFSVAELIQEADVAVRLGNKKLTLQILSPGGEVYASFAMYDYFRSISNKGVKTTAVVLGYAASAAAAIALQAADVRTCYPSTRFLLHEIRRWSFGGVEKTSDLKDETREFDALNKMITDILIKRCGKTEKEISDLTERKEIWLSAKEALDWGLIDKIIK